MASSVELAWAGGLFEGEGTITSLSPSSVRDGKRYARLQIAMNDRDVVERFATIIDVGSVRKYRLWTWTCGRAEDVLMVLRALWPYLGERRRARALEVAAIAARPKEPHPNTLKRKCPRGHYYYGDNLKIHRGKRSCRACGRMASRAFQRRRRAVV